MQTGKKTLIIEAAIKVFSRDGLEKGKIADIAKEAGIGKGTIYDYFRSKDDIFKAIEQLMFSEIATEFKSIKTSPLSPNEKILHIMNWSLNMSMEMGDTMLIITELWAQASRGHYHGTTSSQLVDFYEEYKLEIEHILDEGIDAGEFRNMNK
ncbi:MAG: TetR/AcrR family transcriptional regulator, partial [Candidatus Marinimicrobia bacterium]|nr:TetR/AcrR family transcriptional regulator [Candidatus Neomarinimicrobiota bacterium]